MSTRHVENDSVKEYIVMVLRYKLKPNSQELGDIKRCIDSALFIKK